MQWGQWPSKRARFGAQTRFFSHSRASQNASVETLSELSNGRSQRVSTVASSILCAGRLAQAGQQVQWLQRVQGGARMHDAAVPPGLHIVYEDADLACVVKPQGMPVAVRPLRSTCAQCDRLALRLSTL